MEIPKVNVFGIAVSRMSMQETIDYIIEAIHQNKPHQVVTINPIMVMMALEDPEFMSIMHRAELIVPDGTGVVWAAKYKGTPVKERVPGCDLLYELMKAGESHRWKVYLLGASPEVIAETASRLKAAYPRIDIVGYHHGYFTPEEDQRIVEEIKQADPQLLFVASQLDRQEPWIHEYRDQLNIPIMMGVGGSFDVIAGRVKRAPKAFQKLHLEWFYRLMKEPTRFKRMLALPKFVGKVIRANEKQQ
jgi:N-acetylglucosaminyldiphosphoundecaprenol N-acetyl-beta-D-mannosaminyltransferase